MKHVIWPSIHLNPTGTKIRKKINRDAGEFMKYCHP